MQMTAISTPSIIIHHQLLSEASVSSVQIILMLTVILTLDFISLSSLLIPSLMAVRANFEAQYITLVPGVDGIR